MTSYELVEDEKVITKFYPPTRAALYSFIKNNRKRVFIVLILSYFMITGLYPLIVGSNKIFQTEGGFSSYDKNLPIPIQTAKPGEPYLTQSRAYGYSFHYTTHFGQSFFSVLIAIFLPFYLLLRLLKHRRLLLSTLYIVTNKRIVVRISSWRKVKSMYSINYRNKKYCTILRTPIHRLLGIYCIYFSSDPVINTLYNAVVLLNSPNDRLDILTLEQANKFLKIFRDFKDNQP